MLVHSNGSSEHSGFISLNVKGVDLLYWRERDEDRGFGSRTNASCDRDRNEDSNNKDRIR